MTFPSDFTWGVATSAYQIEGGREDGKGLSIWDTFAHTPGKTYAGQTGDIACDHYHRWKEDVVLMARLGVNAYRFSIAWTRVIPDGEGALNQAGLGFYDRLVDELLAAGIQPWVTLFHWDLPQALEEQGGWRNRTTADAFASYVSVVGRALGDRVSNWLTINEPWVAAFIGHYEGAHAPGLTDFDAALRAGHHLLLAHGKGVAALRDSSPHSHVGLALDCRPSQPATDGDMETQRHFDGFRNRWFFDPVFGKGYPDDMVSDYRTAGRKLDFEQPGDANIIAQNIDFLGVNYYTSLLVGAGGGESEGTGVAPGPEPPTGYTEMGWHVTPEALTHFLQRVHDEYGPPAIYVTENGASYSDGPDVDDRIDDQRRIEYLQAHVEAASAALMAGVPVAGYFVWSLLDNFEWGHGFSQRFGLVWVDFDNGRRLPKASFDWYKRIITGQ